MSLQTSIEKMLLENPQPVKIKRGIVLVLLKTLLSPRSRFNAHSEKKLNITLYNYVRKIFKSPDRAVYSSLFAPVELVHAFHLYPFSLEIFSAIAASMKLAPKLLAGTEKRWISTDFCSFHRAYMEIARIGLLPRPAFLLATSHTCDGTYKSFSDVSELLSRPFLFLNTPYYNDGISVNYLTRQIEQAARNIEEIRGTKLNGEDLEETFYYSNRARRALGDILELRKGEKPLIFGQETLLFILIWSNLMGSRDGAVLFEAYRKELSRKFRKNVAEIPNKKRILWLHLRPFFSDDLISHLENELDAVIIAEEINSIYWEELDIKKPWESLAKKLINNYWVGGIDKRLRNIRKLIEEFQIDGVIHFSHWGCRQSNGGVRLIKDTVMEYGIPFLNLDGDCIDERNYSKGQYLTRLEGFMEIIG